MTDIDWSKAPEGATHYTFSGNAGYPWLKQDGEEVWYWADVAWRKYSKGYASGHLGNSESRPVTLEKWTGEGLPPVGTVCEWISVDGGEWTGVTIIAHGTDEGDLVAVAQTANEVVMGTPKYFRQIRTPEQIAEEEVQAIRDEIGYRRPQLGPCPVEQMYRLGYRKQVKP